MGGKVWFTAEAAKVVGSYDPASKKIDWVLGTGQNRTHMLYVSDDLKWIVTSNVSSGTINLIDTEPMQASGASPAHTDWNETVVRVGNGSEGFDVSPDDLQAVAQRGVEGRYFRVISDCRLELLDRLVMPAQA